MNLQWYINRLRAMGTSEIAWRMQQKALEKLEKSRFANKRRVDEDIYERKLYGQCADWSRLPMDLSNKRFALEREISLLGPYRYEDFRTSWHAGFQTECEWPLEPSYSLHYKGRDDIGDARTNWELNRGHQFALLAKGYYASREEGLLDELGVLLDSWCEENPFLWGISWTSVMEIAIRCINWMYAAAFLSAAGEGRATELSRRFEVGAANMAYYVAAHYSRFSSSNNHAIVEACALGLAGFAYGNERWLGVARKVLGAEVVRQTHPDGVNREQCLHYQAFFMEAVGLYLLACRKNEIETPLEWQPLLALMCGYVQDCRVSPGTWLEFGDDDEGIILNLCGRKPDVCEYALQLVGLVLDGDMRWSDYDDACETIHWLFREDELAAMGTRSLRDNSASVTYPDGGVTVMRSRNGRVVMGMDHGPLGFGAIAAHGHADALSIQLYVDGECIIGDPGTYIYHCDLTTRDELRATRSHSTVCVGNRDQSEMLGAFMWGRRAECTLLETCPTQGGGYLVAASHDGYAPVTHTRTVSFDGGRTFGIEDRLEEACAADVALMVPGDVHATESDGELVLRRNDVRVGLTGAQTAWEVDKVPYSDGYAALGVGTRCLVRIAGNSALTLHVSA